MTRPYCRAEERRKQIVSVALDLVSKHGVQGATLNRIARGVGITTPALYGHFASRKDILLEVMEDVFENVRELHRSAKNPNALERLREIGLGHTRLVADKEGFALAFFEFIAAPPDEDLREPLGRKELTLVADLVEIVEEGQAQGTIREDIDPVQIAWMIVSRAWTESIAYLMGIDDHWSPTRSRWMLEHILDAIAAPPAVDSMPACSD